MYLGTVDLVAAGYADFPLIADHLQKGVITNEPQHSWLKPISVG